MSRAENRVLRNGEWTLTDTGIRATPVCEVGNALLCYRKGMLCLYENGALTPFARVAKRVPRILERILRLSPRGGVALSAHSAVLSLKGHVAYVNTQTKCLQTEHRYPDGMSHPLGFSRIEGIPGIRDGIYYGEYSGNPQKAPMRLFRRPLCAESAEWECVYTFPQGEITHVHAIVPDPVRNGVLVLTGDEDGESRILLFRDEFRTRELLTGGDQNSRSCVAFPEPDGVYYATDTPFEQNRIWKLCCEQGAWVRTEAAKIDGSCIYGARVGDAMLFNTVVETDSRTRGLHLLLTYRRGAGIKDWYTKVYALCGGKTEMVYQWKKDVLPMGLCQFGSVHFCPSQTVGRVWVSPVAVKHVDGRLYRLERGDSVAQRVAR